MVEIRRGMPTDTEHVVAFQLAMAKETEGIELDEPTVRLGVQAVFDDPAKGGYYVAEAGGEIAGSLLTIPEWSDWRNGTVLWIHSLYVRPEFRRRGVFPDGRSAPSSDCPSRQSGGWRHLGSIYGRGSNRSGWH